MLLQGSYSCGYKVLSSERMGCQPQPEERVHNQRGADSLSRRDNVTFPQCLKLEPGLHAKNHSQSQNPQSSCQPSNFNNNIMPSSWVCTDGFIPINILK